MAQTHAVEQVASESREEGPVDEIPSTSSEPTPPTVPLFGLPVLRQTMGEAVRTIDTVIRRRKPTLHVVLNAAKASKIAASESLHQELLRFDMVHADGTSIVWASRLCSRPLPERVAGIDLMHALLDLCQERGYRPYLLGARDSVLADLRTVLERTHPRLEIAGMHDGYWGAAGSDAEAAVVREVRESKADVLFVALPTPRKEKFLLRYRDELAVPFSMGVGGSFDVIAGAVKRAPVSWQKVGMEWAYRLIQEPRKMWKRYAVTNGHFVLLTVKEMLGLGANRRPAARAAAEAGASALFGDSTAEATPRR